MALTVKIDPIEKITQVMISGLKAEAQRLAGQFARDQLEDAKNVNKSVLGKVPPYKTTVDGREGAPFESVNLNGGSIITEFQLDTGALLWIAKTLVDRSPSHSGRFKQGWVLLADGSQTTWPTDGGNIPPAETYAFINLEPYARKIEIGKTKAGRAFVIQVQNKIAERTAKDAKSQFGRTVDIQFGYVAAVGGYRLQQNQIARHFEGGRVRHEPTQRKDRAKGSEVPSPAVIVRAKKS